VEKEAEIVEPGEDLEPQRPEVKDAGEDDTEDTEYIEEDKKTE
jgi:hypothetical protein